MFRLNYKKEAIFRGPGGSGDATGNVTITEIQNLRSEAQLAASEAELAQGYAEEWANKAEDSLVSTAAGGDAVDDFSALHHRNKAALSEAATNADAIATAADAVATASDRSIVETLYDAFDDTYLGAKAVDPTVDNDGNALVVGQMYTNTGTGILRVYNGTVWNDAASSIEGLGQTFTYTATAGQTVFSGNDDTATPMAFDSDSNIQVFYNGSKLVLATDYTVDAVANSITLTSGATAGHVIEISAFSYFELTAIASQAQAEAGADNTQIMTPLRTAQAINAIPRKNFIINGVAPFVNQEGDKVGAASGSYIADIWKLGFGGVTSVVNLAIATVSSEDWIQIRVTSADSTIGAADVFNLSSIIEGFDAEALKSGKASAKTVTISFKHNHTKTGTYCCALRNSANDRSYVFEYTQSVSDTEETHTETIALDTTGTWLVDNGGGIQFSFCGASGTNFQSTAGSWQAGNFVATSNQVNALDAVDNYIRIRDIQLEIGEVATDPEHISYSEKLAQVQRYCREIRAAIQGETSVASFLGQGVNFPSMRIEPSAEFIRDIQKSPNMPGGSADDVLNRTTYGARVRRQVNSGATSSFFDAEYLLDARL